MKPQKKKIAIPQEWNFYLDVYNKEEFQTLLFGLDTLSLEQVLERFKQMYLLYPGTEKTKFKKIVIDYRNCWRIEQIMKFFLNYKKEIDESSDINFKVVFSRLFWSQLDIFFREKNYITT